MEPDLWMWVYGGTAHGYYATAMEAEEAMREALHPTRQPVAEIVALKVDQPIIPER